MPKGKGRAVRDNGVVRDRLVVNIDKRVIDALASAVGRGKCRSLSDGCEEALRAYLGDSNV